MSGCFFLKKKCILDFVFWYFHAELYLCMLKIPKFENLQLIKTFL